MRRASLAAVGFVAMGCAHPLEQSGDACMRDRRQADAVSEYGKALQHDDVYAYERRRIAAKRDLAMGATAPDESSDLSTLARARDLARSEAARGSLQRVIDDRATTLMHRADRAVREGEYGLATTLIEAAAEVSSPEHPARRRVQAIRNEAAIAYGWEPVAPKPVRSIAMLAPDSSAPPRPELRRDVYSAGHVGGIEHTEAMMGGNVLTIDGSNATSTPQPRRSAAFFTIAGGTGFLTRLAENNWGYVVMDTLGASLGIGSGLGERYRDPGGRAEARFAIHGSVFYRALFGYRGARTGVFAGAQAGWMQQTIGEYTQRGWLVPAMARVEYRVSGPGVVAVTGAFAFFGEHRNYGLEVSVPLYRSDASLKLGYEYRSLPTDAPRVVAENVKQKEGIGLVGSNAVSAALALGFP